MLLLSNLRHFQGYLAFFFTSRSGLGLSGQVSGPLSHKAANGGKRSPWMCGEGWKKTNKHVNKKSPQALLASVRGYKMFLSWPWLPRSPVCLGAGLGLERNAFHPPWSIQVLPVLERLLGFSSSSLQSKGSLRLCLSEFQGLMSVKALRSHSQLSPWCL